MAKSEICTTTIRVPRSVYEQAKSVLERQKRGAGSLSMNDFIVNALRTYLKMYQRNRIDAAFASMAHDIDYQREATLLASQFENSDWEAFLTGEESLKH